MTNQVTLQHGGAYEITLSRSGERGLVVEVFDMEEDASSIAPMTPDEWDCFVARGNKALGRPAPASTPLEERPLRAWDKAKDESETHPNRERAVYCDGTAHGLRAALAMVREQGATVPRAGVAAVVALFETNAIAADKGEQYGKDTRNAHLEACSKAEAKVWRRAAAEARATLEATGLWPLPTPTETR